MSKICQECQEERKDSDFLNSETCYKCVYAKKTDRRERFGGSCRVCGEACPPSRWVYCSKGCSSIGELKQKKDYWTAKVPYL